MVRTQGRQAELGVELVGETGGCADSHRQHISVFRGERRLIKPELRQEVGPDLKATGQRRKFTTVLWMTILVAVLMVFGLSVLFNTLALDGANPGGSWPRGIPHMPNVC